MYTRSYCNVFTSNNNSNILWIAIAIAMMLCISKEFVFDDLVNSKSNRNYALILQEQSVWCHKSWRQLQSMLLWVALAIAMGLWVAWDVIAKNDASHMSNCKTKLIIATTTAIKMINCNVTHWCNVSLTKLQNQLTFSYRRKVWLTPLHLFLKLEKNLLCAHETNNRLLLLYSIVNVVSFI